MTAENCPDPNETTPTTGTEPAQSKSITLAAILGLSSTVQWY